jgi:hypothetical protein
VAVSRSRFTRSPGCDDSPCFLNMVQPISLFSGRHISIRASESGVRGCSQLGIIKRDPETHPTGNPRTNLKRHSQQPPSRTRNAPFPLIPHITMQFCHMRSDSSIDAGVPYGTGVREGVRRRPVRQSICRCMPMKKSHFSYVQARTFSPFSLLFPSICLIADCQNVVTSYRPWRQAAIECFLQHNLQGEVTCRLYPWSGYRQRKA